MDNNNSTTPTISGTSGAAYQSGSFAPGSTPAASIAPSGRPMEQVVPQIEAPKKKKTGLIIGLIVAAVLIIGGGIAVAVVLLTAEKPDPVAAAMKKIMRGDMPNNLVIDGDIDIAVKDRTAPISSIKISLNSGLVPHSLTNNSVANVTLSIRNVGDFDFEFDEIYTFGGDLYFKISGAADSLESSGLLYVLSLANRLPNGLDCGADGQCQTEELNITECSDGENCQTLDVTTMESEVLKPGGQSVLNEDTLKFFASLVDIVEMIDGEWIRVSFDELDKLPGSALEESKAGCIANVIGTINTNSNSAGDLYNSYPFVTSTDKNVEIGSKQYKVRKIDIDDEKFAGYINSIQNSSISEKLYSCLGWDNNVHIDENDVAGMKLDFPEIYAEVDGEDNFTRLYVKSNLENSAASVTMDLNFSYPNNINVPEPQEYRDFSDIIQELSTTIYDTGIDN